MAKRTSVSSIQFAAFISLLLAFAPIGDFSVLELSTELAATTIAPPSGKSNAELATTSAPRYSLSLNGAKQKPLNALVDEFYSQACAPSYRLTAQFDLAHNPKPEQFWIVGDRSPPTAIL